MNTTHQPGTTAVLATGFQFPEGPVVSADGQAVTVVNTHINTLSRYDIATGQVDHAWVRLPGSGRANGATLGNDAMLYVANVGSRCIDQVDPGTRTVTTIATTDPDGRPLLGPNDIICDTDGALYFTDPDGSSKDHPIGAVYRLAPRTRAITRMADRLAYPNGLVVSADGHLLYVAISELHQVVTIDLKARGEVKPFVQFADFESPDGMRWGPDGHLYVALYGAGVIAKVTTNGHVTARYPMGAGAATTNLALSPDGSHFYVTEAETGSLIALWI